MRPMEDIVKMGGLCEGAESVELKVGQIIMVEMENQNTFETMEIPMTIIRLYEDGSFDGKIIWEEA